MLMEQLRHREPTNAQTLCKFILRDLKTRQYV